MSLGKSLGVWAWDRDMAQGDDDKKKHNVRGGGFVPVGDVVANMAAMFADHPRARARSLDILWAEVVGEQVARHSHPERFTRGQMTIRVDSSVWVTQLLHMKPQLLASLLKASPGSGIHDLRFVQGSLRHKGDHAEVPVDRLPPPSPEEVTRAMAMVENVSDPDLRQALCRLAQVILIRRRCG
ncbi:MAG: DUF721 domain-containing protein [Magnetococcales bacterium]|nr:DUF721 domain-containing protein [Magnetococcales bacterium]